MRRVLVLLLGGCDGVLGLVDIHPVTDGAGTLQPCMSRDPSDDFMMTMTCGVWGTPTGNVLEGNGKLTITPVAGGGAGGCISKVPVDFTAPVFVAVPQVTLSGDSYVTLSATTTDPSQVSATFEFELSSGAASLVLFDTSGQASVGYDA